jgi:hypothetical protein
MARDLAGPERLTCPRDEEGAALAAQDLLGQLPETRALVPPAHGRYGRRGPHAVPAGGDPVATSLVRRVSRPREPGQNSILIFIVQIEVSGLFIKRIFFIKLANDFMTFLIYCYRATFIILIFKINI